MLKLTWHALLQGKTGACMLQCWQPPGSISSCRWGALAPTMLPSGAYNISCSSSSYMPGCRHTTSWAPVPEVATSSSPTTTNPCSRGTGQGRDRLGSTDRHTQAPSTLEGCSSSNGQGRRGSTGGRAHAPPRSPRSAPPAAAATRTLLPAQRRPQRRLLRQGQGHRMPARQLRPMMGKAVEPPPQDRSQESSARRPGISGSG